VLIWKCCGLSSWLIAELGGVSGVDIWSSRWLRPARQLMHAQSDDGRVADAIDCAIGLRSGERGRSVDGMCRQIETGAVRRSQSDRVRPRQRESSRIEFPITYTGLPYVTYDLPVDDRKPSVLLLLHLSPSRSDLFEVCFCGEPTVQGPLLVVTLDSPVRP
jgi:hypothetical protein